MPTRCPAHPSASASAADLRQLLRQARIGHETWCVWPYERVRQQAAFDAGIAAPTACTTARSSPTNGGRDSVTESTPDQWSAREIHAVRLFHDGRSTESGPGERAARASRHVIASHVAQAADARAATLKNRIAYAAIPIRSGQPTRTSGRNRPPLLDSRTARVAVDITAPGRGRRASLRPRSGAGHRRRRRLPLRVRGCALWDTHGLSSTGILTREARWLCSTNSLP